METTLAKSPESKNTHAVKYRKPRYYVSTEKHGYKLSVNVPGCTKNGISISHEKKTLSITATPENLVDENWKLIHEEIIGTEFRLDLELNVDIDTQKIKAKTENGVLEIELPLSDASKPTLISVE